MVKVALCHFLVGWRDDDSEASQLIYNLPGGPMSAHQHRVPHTYSVQVTTGLHLKLLLQKQSLILT